MVVVHRAFGYRFIIYKDDHDPPHVHVRAGGELKVMLCDADGDPKIVKVTGEVTRPDQRRIVREVRKQQSPLLTRWKELHG
ncbi:DUF4160 domain-containing protein [uncultured Sphingomonas sp.]|uniref:DUF4160 domain-containing protein n=1 Tax=uncultured Sphingomonas sp. TaxID=158754 RepID=UPI0035CC600F